MVSKLSMEEQFKDVEQMFQWAIVLNKDCTGTSLVSNVSLNILVSSI